MNVGVQFSNINATDGKFTLDDNFFSGEATEGDQIYTLDADAWDINQYDKQGVGNGWLLTPADKSVDPEFVSSIKVGTGDLLYYVPALATELTLAGQVAQLGEQSVTFDVDNAQGQWMFPLVNPFPIDTTWGDLNTFTKEGDQLYTLDADAWDINQYDRQGDGYGWLLTPADKSVDPEYITDDDLVAIPAGGAAYYVPVQTVTWTVTL